MHRQFYDDEDELEPRATPKPATKFDMTCFVVPTVPEVSLIFEKPKVQNLNEGANQSSSSLARSAQSSNNTAPCISPTPLTADSQNSYAAWRERNYSRENNSTNSATHVSPLCKDARNYNRASPSGSRNTSERDKIRDTQDRSINMKSDKTCERSVKFKHPSTNNSHDLERSNQLPSDRRHMASCNSLQAATCNVIDCAAKIPGNVNVNTPMDEHLQIPASYPRYPHTFQPFYAPNYPNRDMDNNETVRTLLQLVNNQSEQIKTLQLQVDRLVRLQEESFRSKAACVCLSSHANQMFGYPHAINYDTANVRSPYNPPSIKKSTEYQSALTAERKDPENLSGDKDGEKLALLEQQSNKAFVEQKVSIGVMTSFEFTVQNNPFLVDSEMHNKKETYRNGNGVNLQGTLNMHDATESVQRYKNTFARKPGTAELENIVEDTESYLSSSQQQSSNCNANSSVRDLDKNTSKRSDLYNTTNRSESPRMYQCFATNSKEKIHEEMCARKDDDMDESTQDARIVSNAPINVGCGSIENANWKKALVAGANDFNVLNEEKRNDRRNANRHILHDIHLPANYHQNPRNKEHDASTKYNKEVDDSITLSDLRIPERPPPTPEPSIHVEMQDYTSDDDSDKPKHTSKIGWTFYNNVLKQVNEILQNSDVAENDERNIVRASHKTDRKVDVKTATLEQLRKLGISLTENELREPNSNNKTLNFDSSFYPRLDHHANMTHTTSIANETNTSMHMRALALKYLSDEQLAEIALQKQGSSFQHLMSSNMQGTNMSFATMRYLERYQLLPGRNNVQMEGNVQMEDVSKIHDGTLPRPAMERNNPALRQFPFIQTPGTTCPSRVLDISALKRQPKL